MYFFLNIDNCNETRNDYEFLDQRSVHYHRWSFIKSLLSLIKWLEEPTQSPSVSVVRISRYFEYLHKFISDYLTYDQTTVFIVIIVCI